MRSSPSRSISVTALLALLSGCAGGGATPSQPLISQEAPSHVRNGASSCPCIYVTNDGLGGQPPDAVLVFAGKARGRHATPTQDIAGSKTYLKYPDKIAVDATGNIYLINLGILSSRVLVFSAGATGNVAPIEDIHGPSTELRLPSGIAVSPLNGDIYVANESNSIPHTPEYKGYVLIFPPKATGDTPPTGMIAGAKTNLNDPIGIAFDATGNLYVANQAHNGIAVFAAGSVGNVAPMQLIAGKATLMVHAEQPVPDPSLNIHVLAFSGGETERSTVLTFAAGANGDVAPIQQIDDRTALGIALDGAGNTFAGKYSQRGAVIAVYPPGANGHVLPAYVIQSPGSLDNVGGIAIR
jgi:hypothetical protein